jgi:hypothetical protein
VKPNLSSIEAFARITGASALISLALFGTIGLWGALAGVYLFVTGVVRRCLIYFFMDDRDRATRR